jgi:hypothetical protein
MIEPKSICDQIECLARLTGAPESFVEQVKALFSRKGISLEDDAAPFLAALEEAFRREERIRSTSRRARLELAKLQKNFERVGQAYVQQISQQKQIQGTLRDQARRMRGAGRRSATHRVTIQGDHRTFVTRQEREELPLVPGPSDLQ